MRRSVLLFMVLLAGCDKPNIPAQIASPRFQLVPNNSAPILVLDTQTGALWRAQGYTTLDDIIDDKPLGWVQIQQPIIKEEAKK
jgi:hypothetical protein